MTRDDANQNLPHLKRNASSIKEQLTSCDYALLISQSAREQAEPCFTKERVDFVRELIAILSVNPKDRKLFYTRLHNLVSKELLSSEQIKLLFDYVNKENSGILNDLKGQYPFLSQTDMELFCFFTLDFPIRDICTLYKIQREGTLYTKRFRLKKQMGIAGNLNQFLKQRIEILRSDI